ncbi:hypothetical protein PFLUV_G00091290 [Perca fluviatilis]|uniref:Uncharacterized protein n=1 Tax=Perca fluviatilis TaxID=8168 RepID=A0A6A5EGT6_PERFL|nr:hypothetical protein PFLUV_G00091290 [Perca fluviatilis]
MFSFKMLLLAVALLAVPVESGDLLTAGLNLPSNDDPLLSVIWDKVFDEFDLDYDSPVVRADRVVRPVRSLRSAYGPISHSGVRVTLEDGSQWLIHKGNINGADPQMLVTSADNMSSKWKTMETREFNRRKSVADFVRAGGDTYDVRRANCHHATDAMMNL